MTEGQILQIEAARDLMKAAGALSGLVESERERITGQREQNEIRNGQGLSALLRLREIEAISLSAQRGAIDLINNL